MLQEQVDGQVETLWWSRPALPNDPVSQTENTGGREGGRGDEGNRRRHGQFSLYFHFSAFYLPSAVVSFLTPYSVSLFFSSSLLLLPFLLPVWTGGWTESSR